MFVKWLPRIIIIVLIVIVSVQSCHKQTIKQSINIPDSTAYYKGKLLAKERESDRLKEKWSIDSLEMKSSEIEYKQLAAKNAKERDKARQNIQNIVNTVPEVKKFVEVDSLSDKATTDRVKELELEKVQMTTSFFDMLHAKDEELQVSKELIQHQGVVIVELNDEVKKQRRGKTTWKIITGLVGAVLLYEVVTN